MTWWLLWMIYHDNDMIVAMDDIPWKWHDGCYGWYTTIMTLLLWIIHHCDMVAMHNTSPLWHHSYYHVSFHGKTTTYLKDDFPDSLISCLFFNHTLSTPLPPRGHCQRKIAWMLPTFHFCETNPNYNFCQNILFLGPFWLKNTLFRTSPPPKKNVLACNLYKFFSHTAPPFHLNGLTPCMMY